MSAQWTSWSGRQIAWERRGAGPALVLCHGTPWSSVTWGPVVERLATNYTVYTWDLPGYGRSSKSAEHPVDLRTQARTFAALLEEWELSRPRVVAHDIGGAVALGAHLLDGVDFASLTLIDTVTIRPWGSEFFRLVQEHADVFTRLPANLHRALVEEYVASASRRPMGEDLIASLAEPWLDSAGQAAFYRQIAQVRPEDTDPIEDRLAQIRCPVQVIWGAEDVWLPLAVGRDLAARLPEASLSVLDDAGHLAQLDRSDAVARLIRDHAGS